MDLPRSRGRGLAKGKSPVRGRGCSSVRSNMFTSTRGLGRGRTTTSTPQPTRNRLDWNALHRLATTQDIPAAVNELLPESNEGGSQWDTPNHGEEYEDDCDWDNYDDEQQQEIPDSEITPPAYNHIPRSFSYPTEANWRRSEFVRGGSSAGNRNLSEETPLNRMPQNVSADNEDTQKVLILPVGKNSFEPHEIIREIAARCITSDYRAGWTGMRDVPAEAFERWFNSFRQIARWDSEHNLQVRQNFRRKCGQVIRNSWASVRAGRSKKGPAFSNPDILAANRLKWDTDATFKALSEQNKQNCKGEKSGRGHSTHRGGPKPPQWHRQQLALDLGRNPTSREMFRRLIRKPDGTYLIPDGRRLMKRYKKKLKARIKSGLTAVPVPENEDMKIFTSVVGLSQRDKLPRVLGAAATLIPGSRFQSHTSASFYSSHVSQSQQQPGIIDPAIVDLMKSFSESIEMKLKVIVKETVQEALHGDNGGPTSIPPPGTGTSGGDHISDMEQNVYRPVMP